MNCSYSPQYFSRFERCTLQEGFIAERAANLMNKSGRFLSNFFIYWIHVFTGMTRQYNSVSVI